MSNKDIIKRQPHLFIIIPVITIIISALFYVVFFIDASNEENKEYITAFDGYGIAEDYSDNGTLVHVQLKDATYKLNDGAAESWTYVYLYYDALGNFTREMDICVYSNNSVDFTNYSNMNYIPFDSYIPHEIYDWEIDSDEAYKIAIDNPEISGLQDDFSYITLDYLNNKPMWLLFFTNYGLGYDIHNAIINIDATTGEVLLLQSDYP